MLFLSGFMGGLVGTVVGFGLLCVIACILNSSKGV